MIPPGQPERRGNHRRDVDKENQERLARIEAAVAAWTRRTSMILVLLFVATLGVGVISIYLLVENGNRTDDIQNERVATTLHACLDQNIRHDITIDRLNHIISQIKDPKQRARAEASEGSTIALIDALAPHRDCRAVVKAAVPSRNE